MTMVMYTQIACADDEKGKQGKVEDLTTAATQDSKEVATPWGSPRELKAIKVESFGFGFGAHTDYAKSGGRDAAQAQFFPLTMTLPTEGLVSVKLMQLCASKRLSNVHIWTYCAVDKKGHKVAPHINHQYTFYAGTFTEVSMSGSEHGASLTCVFNSRYQHFWDHTYNVGDEVGYDGNTDIPAAPKPSK